MSTESEPVEPHRFISNSEIQTHKECKRKWYLGYYRRLTKRRADGVDKAARTGSIVHDSLEEYYRGTDKLEVLQNMRVRRAEDPLADQYTNEWSLAEIMVEGYFQWLDETGADQDFRIWAVEEKITAPAPEPFGSAGVWLIGKLDLIAERVSDGTLFKMDHKTVQNFDQMISSLPQNEQSRHYGIIQRYRHPDRPLQGAIWNMLRKVKRSARANPPFYMRYEIRWNAEQYDVFWDRLRGEIGDMLETQYRLDQGASHHVVAYPSPGSDCHWKCEFYPVCHLMDDPRTDSEMMIDVMFTEGDPLARYEEKEPDA